MDTETTKQAENQREMPAPRVVPAASDPFATELRGFGLIGLLSIAVIILLTGTIVVGTMVTLPVGPVLVLVWAWRSQTPWAEIGYARPRSWVRTVTGGLAFGIAFKFLMKAVVMPLFGADAINHAYSFLTGNRALLPQAIWAMLVAGCAEETIYRGFVFERLGKLLGSGALASAAIVLFTSAWFGYDHYAVQGLAGVEQATIVGLVFGTIYAATGRIWMLMIAHAAFDLTALAMIYWGLETRVAHLIFR